MGARATGALLGVFVLAFAAMHVSIVTALFARKLWGKGASSIVLPPLVPWWGWKLGMRRRTMAWMVALAAYTIGVIAFGALAAPWSGR